jgi:DEAD/DEAH box helicase domain-containing protein
VRVAVGDILVRSQATKFKKLKFHTNENVGYGDISLPADEMHTRACALVFDPGTAPGRRYGELSEAERAAVMAGLGALLSTVAPVFLLCDPRDLGVSERTRDPHFDQPCLFFFDRYPGGIGLSEGFSRDIDRVLAAAADHVAHCACAAGCPSCVGAPDEQSPFNAKDLAARFLEGWIADAAAAAGSPHA